MSKLVALFDLARQINEAWQRTTDGVLQTASLCSEANLQLKDPKAKKRFIEKLHFDPSTFSKLVKIGDQPQLQAEPVKSLLPANYSIVYEVAGLNEQELDAAIDDQIIKPKMTRKALKLWIEKRRGTNKADNKPRVIATLQVPKNFDEQKQAQLENSIEELKKTYGLIIERPRDPQEAALRSVDKKVVHRIRQRAQEFVDRLGSLAKWDAEKRGIELSEKERKQWWYSEEEEDIPKNAGWDEIRSYLDRIGHEYQFERLVEEALVLNGVDEDKFKDHPLVNHEEAMGLLKLALMNATHEQGVRHH